MAAVKPHDPVAELFESMSDARNAAESPQDSKSSGKSSEKAKDKSKPPSLGRLVSLSRPEWPALSRAVLVAVACIGIDLLAPEIRKIMDDVLLYPHMQSADIYGILSFEISSDKALELRRLVLWTLALRGVSAVLGFAKGITFALVSERVVARMRLRLFRAIVSQEMGFFDTRTSGELSSRLGPDALSVQMVATTGIPDVVISVIKMSLAIAMMFAQSWELSAMVLGLLPCVFCYLLPFAPLVMWLNKEYQDAKATSSDIATQMIGNARVVRCFGADDFAAALYSRAVGDPGLPGACCWWPKNNPRSVYRAGVVMAVIQQLLIQGSLGIASAGIQAISWYGYHMTIESEISYGTFGAFMTYAMLVGFNAGLLIKTLYGMVNAMGASQRVFEIIDRQPAILAKGGTIPERLDGGVAFEDVSFCYPSRPDVLVLSGLTFQVPAKSKAAFVGASGAGKSTIFALLERLYDVSGGRVLIDGQDVRTLDAGWLRRRVGVVQQEPVLFGFSIRENIRFGRTASCIAEDAADASEEDLVEAAAKANAHGFITAFPDGYSTVVGERGVRLSGGQKQRIAIARAMLCKPQVMLLDEATSALDAESEHAVQKALDAMMVDRTVLIIAHRLSTTVNADQIMVMTKQGIADCGKHEQLLERCELYQDLVRHQLTQNPNSEVNSLAGSGEATKPEPGAGNQVPAGFGALTSAIEDGSKENKASLDCNPRRNLDDKALEEIIMMSPVTAESKKTEESTDRPTTSKPFGPFFWKLVRPELPVLLLMLVLTLGCTAVEAWLPMLSGDAVNYVVASYDLDFKKREVARIMTTMLLLSVGIQIWHYIRVIISSMAGERVVARLRQCIFRAIFRQELAFFDTQTSGALTSRLTSDTQLVQVAVGTGFIETCIGLARAGAAIAMAFNASPQLAGMTLLVGPAMGIVLCLPIAWILKLSVLYNDALARAAHVSTEATGSMKTVLSFGSEAFVQMLYDTAIGRLDGPGVRCWWPRKSHSTYRYGVQRAVTMRISLQIAIWLGLSLMTLIVWYGYHLILVGELSFGGMFAFFMFTMNIAQGLASFSGGIGSVVAAKAALQRVIDIECREPAMCNEGGERPEHLSMEVQFDAVSFSYPSRPEVQVLQELSFAVPANSTAAFVGASGSGKSTVLALLQRFYDVGSGRIRIGGHDVATLDASWLRRRIGVVQQEPVLFGISVRANIAYGRNAALTIEGGQPVTDEEIHRVSKMAHAHEFVSDFPQGYATPVGERGVMLSGGQKQRVAIARALLLDPKILLLDEATSALDAASEQRVQEAIDQMMASRTTLVVAHRLSTVRNASQILVLDAGRLVDVGRHEELLERCGRYQELTKHQMQVSVGQS